MIKIHTLLQVMLVTAVLLFCSGGLATHFVLPVQGRAVAGELPPLFPGYPEVFDYQGTLEVMHQDQIVVNDAALHLLSVTTFHTPNGQVGQFGIAIGSRVGLLLTEERGVRSVWFLEAGENEPPQDSEQEGVNSGTDSSLKYENGVWKN